LIIRQEDRRPEQGAGKDDDTHSKHDACSNFSRRTCRRWFEPAWRDVRVEAKLRKNLTTNRLAGGPVWVIPGKPEGRFAAAQRRDVD
jgi:hypothetical protein